MAERSPPARKATITVVDLPIDPNALESRAGTPQPGLDIGSQPGDHKEPPLRKDTTFETAEGTLHVKPFRKKGAKGLKAVLTFVPRASAFDRENLASGADPFRGFFTLFWIAVFLLSIRTYWDYLDKTGYPISLDFANLLSKDAITLLLSDMVLVSSTALVIPFMLLVQRGWIRYYWIGVFIQHCFQTVFLGAAVAWTFNRQWPWVQSGFFTLHSLTMLMKIHSYCSVNGHYSYLQQQHNRLTRKLQQVIESDPSLGSWDEAVKLATETRDARIREKERADAILYSSSPESAGTPATSRSPSLLDIKPPQGGVSSTTAREALHSSTTTSNGNLSNSESQLRNRLSNLSSLQTDPTVTRHSLNSSAPLTSTIEDPLDSRRHILCHHPSLQVSRYAQEMTELDMELTAPGGSGNKEATRWPKNITLRNFVDYMLIPTLVYEMQYPRTASLRPLYVLEKTIATFGTFTLLYTYTEHYIIPLTPTLRQNFFRSIIDLILPFMLCYLLLFYIIFECICNGFAELSFFADRQFYEDWWNSTSMDEFSRKWNKPVHVFLLRHVYASTISTFGFSRSAAAFSTFLLSALAHELVMAVVTQKIRLYLFLLQMIQIPMIAMGRLPVVKRNPTAGNVVFWFGLLTGFPLLCVAYCAY
ncbi:MBOAT-domain-containing protein [Clavulina sp. PMI_390]|nr:MBOAT-domain-containing protein [Clavulina sp. PMI_390]